MEDSLVFFPSVVRRWARSPFGQTALGGLLLWLAQPGTTGALGAPALSLGWLAWLAPAVWVGLVLRPDPFTRWQYVQVWLGMACYWLLMLHWVCYPHPLTPIGWPFLCAYLAVYGLLFVWLTRAAIRRTVVPAWVAAPVVWVALEYVQAHLFTGFQVGALSHTQAFYPLVIQVSDLGGGYAVSFLVMMCAAALAFALHKEFWRVRRAAAVTAALAAVGVALSYGHVRLAESEGSAGPIVALVQGAALATWDPDPNRSQQIMDAHANLTRRASELAQQEKLKIDLIVWPESMFRVPVVTIDNGVVAPADMPDGYARAAASTRDWLSGLATTYDASLLLGVDRFDLTEDSESPSGYAETIYNSAVLTDKTGRIVAVYDKTHRVPFGEYIPFASNLPALYYLTPMSGGLGEGRGPVAMELETTAGSVTLSPSICYESVLPHVIRRQVAELAAAGKAPELLVNVTNDAWFWGASELDLHLASGVYRAVENRRPLVVAANTGLSAIIDGSGRVLEVSTRMREEVILAQVPLDARASFYNQYGDWFALSCVVATVLMFGVGLSRKESPPANPTGSAAGTPPANRSEPTSKS